MIQVEVVGIWAAPSGDDASVEFASSCGERFTVTIPAAQTDAVRRALGGTPNLLTCWMFGSLFDGVLTEVLIEEDTDQYDFSLVLSSEGTLLRIPVTPIDGILTGLEQGAPFMKVRRWRADEDHRLTSIGLPPFLRGRKQRSPVAPFSPLPPNAGLPLSPE